MNLNTRKLHDLGQSLWLDNITREILTNGTLARYISDLSVTGLTSNPTIFEHAIGTGGAYDEAIGGLARQGVAGEDLFIALALDDLTPGSRPVPTGVRSERRRRRLGFARGVAAPRRRHGRDGSRRGATTCRGRTTEHLHQDSRYASGPTGDRAIDLRRRADQRHAALLARAVPRRGRRVPARHRASHRGRSRSEGPVGRLTVREPLGRRGEGRDLIAIPQPARHRRRDAYLQGVPRSARIGALANACPGRCAERSGCSGPAPAPRIPPRPTRSTSRRSQRRIRSTRFPTRPCWRSPIMGRSDRRHAGRRRRRRGSARRIQRARASTTMRSPHVFNAKVLTPSRNRGRRCCRASRKRAHRCAGDLPVLSSTPVRI